MNPQRIPIGAEALVAWLEAADQPEQAEALRHGLIAAGAAPEELEAWRRMWHDLHDIGADWRHAMPSCDVQDAVMERVRAGHLPEDEPSLDAPQGGAAGDWADLFQDIPGADNEAAYIAELASASPEHAREQEQFAAMERDLRAMWAALHKPFGAVDLRDAVMNAINGNGRDGNSAHARQGHEPTGAVSFSGRRQARQQPFPWAWAAAAALLIALGVAGFAAFEQQSEPNRMEAPLAAEPPPAPEPETVPVSPDEEVLPPAPMGWEPLREALQKLAETRAEREQPQPRPAATQAPLIAPGSIENVWDTRRAALTDADASARLRAMATLAPESARDVLKQDNLPARVLLAAAEALPADEGFEAVYGVTARVEAGAEVRPATTLAQAQLAEKAGAPEQPALLYDLAEQDPNNALPLYLLAIEELDAGNLPGALSLLEEAAGREYVTVYSTEGAQATREALTAAGMDDAVAANAAAASAGLEQYETIVDAGTALIGHAENLLEEGQQDPALELFTSAQRMGEQIERGAAFSWEQLGGIDVQRDAIDGLEDIYGMQGDTESMQELTEDALALLEGLERLSYFFDALDQLLLNPPQDTDYWIDVSELILESGDLALFPPAEPVPPAQEIVPQ